MATTDGDRLLDEARAELAASRALLADSERRAAAEHEFALRLQRAIMPSAISLLGRSGVDICARCRPGVPAALVAGDWHDALQFPGGDLLLAVGDIAGHGIDAVTGMVAARNALRGLAVTGADPAELVAKLNCVACMFAEGLTGTVVCARYNAAARVLTWARAGHLPPVLVRAGRAQLQPLPEGLMLGVESGSRYEQLSLRLQPGDTLLLFTDGLIERRSALIDDGLAEFAAAAVPADPDLNAHVSRILDRAASDTGDDACLMAVRVR